MTVDVSAKRTVSEVTLDPVTFEVLRNALASIVEEAGAMLERTALNPVINEGLDFACSFTTRDGRVVAQGQRDIPAFIGTAPIWVKRTLEWIGIENFAPGDVVLMNDPFLGGTHCQDVKTLVPVFWGDELIAFVQNCAHWIDCGGAFPGSYNPRATHAVEEALLITPIHIMRKGELEENALRLILRNVRDPETTLGDLMGQIEACRLGERRLHDLIGKYGRDVIVAEMEAVIEYSATLLRKEWEAIPDGTYRAVDFIDGDPTDPDRGPVKVALTVTIEGSTAHYDFSESDTQVRGGVNGPMSVTVSAAMLATKAMFPHIPMNEGIYEAINWELPEGLVVSAEYPAPISGMASTVVAKTIDNLYRCFIQVTPMKVMCAQNNLLNLIFSGWDSREGYDKQFILYMWLDGGWGARPARRDNGTGHPLHAASAMNIPIERYERDCPVIFRRYEFAPDSEGAGRHRGGFGVVKSLQLTHGGGQLSVQGDRGAIAPWGFEGGGDGSPNVLTYEPGKALEADIGVFAAGFQLQERSTVEVRTCGGGGFGRPYQRDLEWVLEDVAAGLISLARAESVYGVAIETSDDGGGYSVDVQRTEALREALRVAEGASG